LYKKKKKKFNLIKIYKDNLFFLNLFIYTILIEKSNESTLSINFPIPNSNFISIISDIPMLLILISLKIETFISNSNYFLYFHL
jgi:hypothetical protein